MARERQRRGFFDRPLWRILVPLIILSFGLHRVAAGILAWSAGVHPMRVASYGVVAVAAIVVAVILFRGGDDSSEE